MPARLLTLFAAVLAVVLLAGCEPPTSYAAKVGDTTITEDDLDTWLEVFSTSPTLQSAVFGSTIEPAALQGEAPGSYAIAFADAVLGILVEGAIHEEEFQRRHLESDADLEDQIRTEVLPAMEGELTDADLELTDAFVEDLIVLFAHRSAVINELGDGWQDWVNEQYTREDIEVNPKYGSWTATASVQPPAGPLLEPAGT